jgi:outer membrane protein assembly factor BamB
MRNRSLVVLSCLLAGVLMSCGGNGPTPIVRAETGKATFTVQWPKRTRLIPAASNSIVVAISMGTTALTQQVLARPAAGGTASVSFSSLPVATLSVTATAYPNADGTGTAQATATTPLVIQANQTTNFSLTMSSTVVQLVLTAPQTSLTVGQAMALGVAGKDTNGNTVLLSASKLTWLSSNTTAATIDTNGNVTALAAGSANISVTDSESGKSATIAITVSTPAPTVQQSVAYQINAAHSGYATFGQPLTFPSSPTWSVDFGTPVGYPLIANGIVYIMANNGNLYALSKTTGKSVWGPVYSGRAHCYDNGQVFVLTLGGTLSSFNAATGAPGWSVQLPAQYEFSATPTAINGVIYISGAGEGGTVYAVSETSGALLWSQSVENGDQSSPTVTSDGLFVSYPCQVYSFNPTTGTTNWHYNGGCDGGGGKTDAYANGLLYDREGGTIYNALTGAQIGPFQGGRSPALGSMIGYFLNGTLQAINLSSRSTLWSFAGDGNLVSAPLLIDQTVIIGSGSGTVYALDATTGNQIWSGSAGAAIPAPDEQNLSQPLTGFGAGEGYLIVAAGTRLTAWHIAGP